MAETGRVFIWVQHLLGIGHLVRMAHLARHLAASGWRVDLVSGGAPLHGLDLGRAQLRQLPPLKAADSAFTALADLAGNPVSEAVKAARRDRLLELFAAAEPDVVVVEHYPFGRRQMRFELEPLLAAAAEKPSRPMLCSSVRDILVERKREREEETLAALSRFDAVLVHGDPALVGLGQSFRAASRLGAKLRYTGYIGGRAPVPDPPPRDGEGEIVVSAGGGAVGHRIAEAAIAAAAASPSLRWRILVGANAGEPLLAQLRAKAPASAIVEPARWDFRGLLARCAVSVSQAGYNTVVDLLAAGARAVLVPFAAGRETEQALRAERLQQRGLARLLPEAALTPERLFDLVAEARAAPRAAAKIKIDGEAETEHILARALAGRAPGAGIGRK